MPLLLVSGICALTYQVAWMREFRLIFGGTTTANAAVLAIFMAGLGVGNLALGKVADATRRPLWLYALLELVIVASAAVSPWLIDFLQRVYVSLGGQSTLGTAGATAVRIALAALVLAVPTIAMGGTLPAAARFATTYDDERRRALGWLYGVNTLGAVIGPIACAFLLLEHFGTTRTIWLAAATNLCIAVAALIISRRTETQNNNVETMPSDRAPRIAAALPASRSHTALLYTAAGVVGFAFFVLELVWYRMLSPLLGGSTYTFGVILAIALAGIGLGAAAYPILFRRLQPTLFAFALTCLLEAICVALPFAQGDHVALMAIGLRESYAGSFAGLVLGWFVIAAAVILPAALVSGVQFPLLIALLGRGREHVGRQVGRAFACNTLGAILGALAGGFWILPALTAPGAWIAVVLLLAALGGIIAIVAWRETPQRRPALAAAALCAVAIFAVTRTGPTAYWRHSSIGAGRGPTSGENFTLEVARFNEAVMWEAEGREANVALLKVDNGLTIMTNGKSDGHATDDAGTQIMLGFLGSLLHPDPKSALIIGLGTGESAGWCAASPTIERVDVVEIEPAMREVAARCAAANEQVLNNPKVRLIDNDAREQLLTSPQRYDLIISEPSNLYRAGVTNLFTQEFYESTTRRLHEGGIFVQWVQAYEVDPQAIAMVLATLRGSFGHVEIWTGERSDLLLVCSSAPLHRDPQRLARLVADPQIARAIRCAWDDSRLESVLAHYLGGPATIDAFLAEHPAQRVTDDRNALEYSLARSVGRENEILSLDLRRLALEAGDWRPPAAEADWQLVQDQWHYWHGRIEGQRLDAQRERRQKAIESFTVDPAQVVKLWTSQPRAPELHIELVTLAHSYAVLGDAKALPLLDQLRAIDPVTADLIRAAYFLVRGDEDAAAKLLEPPFKQLRAEPWASASPVAEGLTAAVVLSRNHPARAERFLELLDEPFAAYLLDKKRELAVESISASR